MPEGLPANAPLPDAVWLRYEISFRANMMEHVQQINDSLVAIAREQPGFLHLDTIEAECDPAGWCRGKVGFEIEAKIEEATDAAAE